MRPDFHVPLSFVSLLVKGTIVISRTSSFYPIAQETYVRMRLRTYHMKCLSYRFSYIVMISILEVIVCDRAILYDILNVHDIYAYAIRLFITPSIPLYCKELHLSRVFTL